MFKITLVGGIYQRVGYHDWFTFFQHAPVGADWVHVCDYTINAEVSGFDQRTAEVKALEAKREALRKEFDESLRKIDQRINSRLAIGCATEVAG